MNPVKKRVWGITQTMITNQEQLSLSDEGIKEWDKISNKSLSDWLKNV
jgi:Fe-S cluster biosynthesis and repair protein YggX